MRSRSVIGSRRSCESVIRNFLLIKSVHYENFHWKHERESVSLSSSLPMLPCLVPGRWHKCCPADVLSTTAALSQGLSLMMAPQAQFLIKAYEAAVSQRRFTH